MEKQPFYTLILKHINTIVLNYKPKNSYYEKSNDLNSNYFDDFSF